MDDESGELMEPMEEVPLIGQMHIIKPYCTALHTFIIIDD